MGLSFSILVLKHTDFGVTAFAAVAKRDLDRFFRLRAKELVPKGKLVVTMVTSDDDMQVDSDLHEHATDAVLDLVNAGKISPEEAKRMMVSLHYRSPGEVRASLEAVGDLFTVDELKFDRIAHPLYQKCLSGELGKPEYAEVVTDFFKAIFEPSAMASLDSSRPGMEAFVVPSVGVVFSEGVLFFLLLLLV